MKVVFIFFNQKANNRQSILSFCLTFASSIAINTMYSPVNGLSIIIKVKGAKLMKRIEAIIRKTKFEDVKEALLQSDIDWFEYHNVHGIGQSREERIYRGVQYSTDVIERVALSIVCRDPLVEPTVKVILDVAHTGEVGDGRIFVSEMIDTWSIRTGEHGDTVLKDKK